MFIDEILEKVDSSKDSGSKDRSNRSKAAVACAIAGLIAGVALAQSKKWHLFYGAAGGAMIGGIVGALFVPSGK